VTGTDPIGQTPTDDDPSHYLGVDSAIAIEKLTNGEDADTPTGPLVAAGSTVTWTYLVTNPGNSPLSNVVVRDDNGTPANPLDDFSPTFVNGDTNNNGLLDPGETWLYTATGTARVGQYGNLATVTGIDPIGQTLRDDDPSHYFGVRSVIDIEKLTNNVDADTPTGPLVAAGSTVTWTYTVTNPGNVPLSNVVVRDDNGTPANPLDDFSPLFVGGDTNNNGLLDPGETWLYTATGTAMVGQYGNVATVTGTDPIGQTPSDSDPSHYFGVNSAIDIEKATNGNDADLPTGPLVAAGSTVTWTYRVTNPGNVPLSNVVVRDDNGTPANPTDDFSPTFVGGDANGNGLLEPGETWLYTATGTALAGQYGNVATVTGTDPIGQTPSDSDPSHYFGVDSAIHIEKATNGHDADLPTGPLVAAGSTVTWTYRVTNPGNVPLANVIVRDDNGTPANPLDDFSPLFVSGDTNNNGLLEPGETWLYTATGTARAGQYGNVATVTGTDPIGQTPSDTDPSHYFGVNAAIQIVKLTNGRDNDAPTGPKIQAGSVVTWTYRVTNPGNVPIANVAVRDDNGTPLDSSDDFSPNYVSGDTNNNGLLDPGETWIYSATGIAQLGQYANMGTVTGTDNTGTVPGPVTDDNPDHYFGVEEPPFIVLGADKNPGTPQYVRVVAADSGDILSQFVAYENNYNGGTRVAVADLDGDGVDEIITVPGRNRAPEIRFFSLEGAPVLGFNSFLAYAANFKGGVHLTVADVNGDGKPDIIAVPSNGMADVRVFFNRHDPLNPSSPAFVATPDIAFRAFSKGTTGGFVVAAADMGRLIGTSFVNNPDGRAEIVVATGAGTKATVTVFDVSGATPRPVRTFNPFTQVSTNFKGGVSLEVAKVDADPIPDIIVGMGVNGTSRIEVWTWNTSNASLSRTGVIPNAFTGASYRAPVNVAAITDSNGFADTIVAVQGPNGTSREIRRFDIVSRSSLIFQQQAPPLTSFPGPWFVATSRDFSNTSAGPLGFRVASLTSLDDSPKFFVVDDRANNVFHYGSAGQHVNQKDFAAGQIQQRGITTTADGSRVWVVDAKKVIRVFDANGTLLGSWTAPKLKKPTGIATNATDLWIVDQGSKLVHRFNGAVSVTSGSLNASSTFKLHKSNTKAEGITTDGDRIWVVDNGKKQDRVYVYSQTGQSLGSWLIDPANAVPTGLTIDPTGASESIWIVDGQQAAVYEYVDAKSAISGSRTAGPVFALAAGNTSPQGIADPDGNLWRNRSEKPADAFLAVDSGSGTTTVTASDTELVQWIAAPLDHRVSTPFGSAVPDAGLTIADLLSSARLNPTTSAIPEALRSATPDTGGFWQDLLEDLTARGTGSQKSADDELFADLGWLEERLSGFPA
jgi:hypothetical protein